MIDTLRALLEGVAGLENGGVRLAVIGGMARGVWARPRATMDVDILVDTLALDDISARAVEVGLTTDAHEVAVLKGSGMTRLRVASHPKGAVRLDVLSADHPYYRRVIDRAVRADLLGLQLPVACAEDLIVLKTLADRTQDRADIEAIVASQGDAIRWALVDEECQRLELVPPSH